MTFHLFQNEVLRKIADLEQMVNAAHETNVVRHHDLQRMWKQFASITKRLQQHRKNDTNETIAKDLKLSNEGRALLAGEATHPVPFYQPLLFFSLN